MESHLQVISFYFSYLLVRPDYLLMENRLLDLPDLKHHDLHSSVMLGYHFDCDYYHSHGVTHDLRCASYLLAMPVDCNFHVLGDSPVLMYAD